jgi:hypothetical protein
MMAEFFFLKAYIIGAVERKNGDDDAPAAAGATQQLQPES